MSVPLYRLEDIATVNYGERVVRKRDGGTKYPVYGGGGATFAIDRYNRENCYIVSRFGMSEQCVRKVDGRFFLNDSGLSVETRDTALLRQGYLDAFLLSNQKRIFNLGTGAAQKNLNVDKFRDIEVPVPSIEDQVRIVALLDEATDAISALESVYAQTASKLNDLCSSALASAMAEQDWPLIRLGDLLDVQNGYAFDSKYFTPKAPIGLIRIRDLRNGMKTETGYVGQFDDSYVVNKGDLLIGMDGEFRCYSWKGESALLNQRVCRLQNFSSHLEPRFLLYCLNSYLNAIEEETAYVTVKHLSSKTIKEISLRLPERNVQERIVALLDEVSAAADEALALASTRLEAAKALRQSILESAFRGEL